MMRAWLMRARELTQWPHDPAAMGYSKVRSAHWLQAGAGSRWQVAGEGGDTVAGQWDHLHAGVDADEVA